MSELFKCGLSSLGHDVAPYRETNPREDEPSQPQQTEVYRSLLELENEVEGLAYLAKELEKRLGVVLSLSPAETGCCKDSPEKPSLAKLWNRTDMIRNQVRQVSVVLDGVIHRLEL